MSHVPRLPALAFLLSLWFPSADAAFRASPKTACAFLSEAGLNTRNYRHIGGGLYRCASTRRRLPFGCSQVHTLSFLAQGEAEKVNEFRLTFYVNSRNQAQAVLRRMLENACIRLDQTLHRNLLQE